MSFTAFDTSDGFGLLYRQLEKDILTILTDTKSTLALIGTIYTANKLLRLTSGIVNLLNTHVAGRLTDGNTNWKEKFGPWAVITGSSEGIGWSYAFELAKRGINVVLISRNEEKLIKAKLEIEKHTFVKVEYIVADFAVGNQTSLYEHIEQQLEGKNIGLLVNNVGVMYDYPDTLLNVSQQKLWQLIYVNICAATMMTYMILPQMVDRGKGGLVVVSSGSSTQITPQMTVYSATKRYLDYFIQGVAYEYRNSGVTFQCLIPFYAATRMTGYSDTLSKTSTFVPNATQFAASAITTLGRSSRTTGYFPHTIQLWVSNTVPSWLWMWAGEKLNNSLRREALSRKSSRKTRKS